MKNYQEIKQEIIDEILKNRRTTSISKKMGFNFDKVARWENGSKQLRWDEFCELCKHTNMPLLRALNDMGFYVKDYSDTLYIVKHVKNYYNKLTVKEFSEMIHTNLSTTNRFIRAESYPDLEFILRIIDLKIDMLPIFINTLIRKKDEKVVSFMKYPWMPAVANAMRLKAFTALPEYSSEWIAAYMGISTAEVDLAVNEFVKMGIIVKNGPHYERANAIVKRQVVTVGGLDLKQEIHDVLKYWTKFIFKKMSAPKYNEEAVASDRCIWRIFPSGPKNLAKVNEILERAEKEIHELLEQNPEEPTDVRVMLLHHFSASVKKD